MPRSNRRREPERLDAHRAARGDGAAEETPPREPGSAPPPAQFEEARALKRARQIERLREAVDADEYRSDPHQIAESMLENERT